MNYDGLKIIQSSPKSVFRYAYANNYISNIDSWLKMLQDRNLTSHTYGFELFQNIIITIQTEYLKTLEELYLSLIEKQI